MNLAEQSERIRKYLEFSKAFPEHFSKEEKERWICLDTEGIEKIECAVAARYQTMGLDPSWAEVGVYYEDPYCLLLRDAVRYRSGREVIHHRLIWKSGPVSGVVMLPRLGDRYVLVRHYRHPIAAWSWECPRGGTSRGEDYERTVEKELLEEIGANVLACRRLGHMIPINSFLDSGVDLFLVEIDAIGRPEISEGIEEITTKTAGELKTMIREGEITDASTICAVAQAEFQGCLD